MDESLRNIRAICAGEGDVIAKMATIACELFHDDVRFDWVGFYRNIGGEVLKIGPYQGGHGCLTIAFARGVCGAAARLRATQLVADVEMFEGHIACASTTRSEIVLPVFDSEGALLGVLDIDSNQVNAFTRDDQAALESMLCDVFSNGQKFA